jgi:flagellar L-ring protein precursor FlgH
MKNLLATLAMAAVFLAGGCSVLPPKPLVHTPEFAPVYPVAQAQPRQPTGAIYVSRQNDSWFGRERNFQVGDVITVLLNESTQSARTQNANVSRKSSNDVIPTNLQNKLTTMGGLLGGSNLAGGTIANTGTGEANQNATLSGSIAVSVVSIMANGNLILRGEKQLALTEGSEIIQVAGIIRQEDVGPNNTVQSRRLANAQITYRGTGDMAAAAQTGWGTSALLKLWPF